jgi:tRNA(Ile)-lysidine synthase
LSFDESVCRAIRKFDMFGKTENILVGVSGGADSICLLHTFWKIFRNDGVFDELLSAGDCKFCDIKKNINLFAVHINHCVRGAEADDDEALVRDLCKKLGIELCSEKVDVPKISKKEKLSLEECGRNIRYSVFNSISKKLDNSGCSDAAGKLVCTKIATAHTLSDSVETVIFNIARGRSLKGVCGIQPVRDNIIRPLIYVTKHETEKYCIENGLKYAIDSTNFEVAYSRNRIRLEIVPALKKINPSFEKCVGRFIDNVSCDDEYLNDVTESEVQKTKISENAYDLKYIKTLPPAIKKRVIYKIFERLSGKKNIETKHINIALEFVDGGYNGVLTLVFGVEIAFKDGILSCRI